MLLKEFPSIQDRIIKLESQKNSPEYKQFDCTDLFSNISINNQEFLAPMGQYLNIYLNCLKGVKRWKDHPYKSDNNPVIDDDYEHTLSMLKISQDLKDLKIESFNFDDIEIIILAHDGGEIITDDIPLYNSLGMENYLSNIKSLEPKVFISCVLGSIKNKDLLPNRSKILELYKNYDSRHKNAFDRESHLVKFIDILQGDYFGLENVYSKKRLVEVFGENNIPYDPDEIVNKNITRQFSQLEIIFKSIDSKSDKEKIFNYFDNNFFKKYNQPEHGYQHIYEKFLAKKEELLLLY